MKHANKVNMKFHYVPASATDIRQTYNREKKKLKAVADAEKKAAAEVEQKTVPIRKSNP